MNSFDHDIQKMSIEEVKQEVERLRNGIRKHRDQKGDDRCWLDDGDSPVSEDTKAA